MMYLAFFASNIVLAGQSLHGIEDSVPVSTGIVLGALGSGLICMVGYKFIHALNKIATWVLGVGIVLAFGAIFVTGVPPTFWTQAATPPPACWPRSRWPRSGRSRSRRTSPTTRGTCPPT